MERVLSKYVHAFLALLIFGAVITSAGAVTMDELASRGAIVATGDPLSVELRNQQPEGLI